MSRHPAGPLVRLIAFVAAGAVAVVVATATRGEPATQPVAAATRPATAAAGEWPGASTGSMIAAGATFYGPSVCNAPPCHGRADPAPPSAGVAGNEFTLWARKDPHRRSFKSLAVASDKDRRGAWFYEKYRALAGGTAADARSDGRCLDCHALPAPAAMRGPGFVLSDGVTCDSCHGPKGKVIEPHPTAGWLAGERRAAGDDAGRLWDKWRFVDLRDVRARAEKCAACHVGIDARMVAAGHPVLQPFDLYVYTTPAVYADRHWRAETGYAAVRAWAVGQAVCLRAELRQLADWSGGGGAGDDALRVAYARAVGRATVFRPLLPAGPAGEAFDRAFASLKAARGANARDRTARTAAELADLTAAATEGVAKVRPDKASTLALLKAIAGRTETAGELGEDGVAAQRDAVFALYSGLATSPDKPADADAVVKMIEDGLYPERFDAAKYAEVLERIRKRF